ncbi:MAG: diacylglycerol kinase family lipid kinase [Clostridium sp.]|nr:diacylglycerol kinase family lipid kinase [Clostridium sp.]
MEPKRLLLIINPVSGTHEKNDIGRYAADRLAPAGFSVETRWTAARGDATLFAREAVAENFYGVLVAGGDGTVNETARGLTGSAVALGILPCGSGNGLARHLGMAVEVNAGLDIVSADNIVDVDYGTVDDRPFLCTFGVGFDAAVSQRFARQPRRGKTTYILSALREFLHYAPKSYRITLPDGRILTEKAFLVAVCNASQYGNNAYIAPRASITDGLLDVTIVHSGSPLTTALVGIDLLTGFIDRNILIDTFRTDALTIHLNGHEPIHIDGEPLTADRKRIDVKCHKGQLRLFAPVKDKPFKPLLTPVQSLITDIRTDLKHIFSPDTPPTKPTE